MMEAFAAERHTSLGEYLRDAGIAPRYVDAVRRKAESELMTFDELDRTGVDAYLMGIATAMQSARHA